MDEFTHLLTSLCVFSTSTLVLVLSFFSLNHQSVLHYKHKLFKPPDFYFRIKIFNNAKYVGLNFEKMMHKTFTLFLFYMTNNNK